MIMMLSLGYQCVVGVVGEKFIREKGRELDCNTTKSVSLRRNDFHNNLRAC